jgi:hypothetical protein
VSHLGLSAAAREPAQPRQGTGGTVRITRPPLEAEAVTGVRERHQRIMTRATV